MNCPRCNRGMTEFVSQGVLIDFCSSCKGTWLDQGEARFFAADPIAVERALAGELIAAHPSAIRCPRCSGAMIEGGLFDPGYLVDRCNECHGVWFDAHELSRLQDRKLLAVNPGAARVARPNGQLGGRTEPPKGPPPPTGAPSPDLGHPQEAMHHTDGAGVLASVPVVPNLFLRGTMVFGGLIFITGLLFISASLFAGLDPTLAVIGTLLVIALQYALGPWILDLTLRWMHSLHWVDSGSLPPHLTSFIAATCQKRGIKVPRIGIIEDGAPNAFTYGHVPNDARVVITRGILDLLSPEEIDAVVGHELGHVVHWDAVVMTLAGCIPILCYAFYRVFVRVGRSVSSSRRGGQVAAASWALAIIAYVLYIASEYLVLLLSRTREYYADRFSAEATGNPNALASALVKVAYGLVADDHAAATQPAAAQPAMAMAADGGRGYHSDAAGSSMRAFGIFDPGAARNLAVASYAGGAFSRENLVGAMQWDLWNPWAGWFELHSTHPLPAKRLQALAGEAIKRGQIPLIVFDKRQPESYWGEFLVDFFIKMLPLTGLLLFLGICALALSPAAMVGGAILGYGLGKLGQTLFAYHLDKEHAADGYPASSVAALLSVVKVSPVRGVPSRLKGKIIGRGSPGYIFSKDVVLQDRTGILFLDYSTGLSLLNWWFALARVPELIGQEVEAVGWYRRGPAPYFELREVRYAGKTRSSWIYPMKLVWSWLCVAAGLLVAVGGYMSAM